MPDALPQSAHLIASLAGVALLGFKHGFDADHLAAIDAMGRLNLQAGRVRLARASGVLFSGGHSLIVMLAALMASWAGDRFVPDWLDATGAWISIVCLSVIGLLSVRAALGSGERRVSPWMRPMMPIGRTAWGATLIGAVFALSFDTLTMAAWFGSSGARLGGTAAVFALACAFAAGMLLADGVSGWWVNRLASRPGLARERGQRLSAGLVGAGALLTAGMGLMRQFAPTLDDWAQSHALALGLSLLVVTSVGLIAAVPLARSRAG